MVFRGIEAERFPERHAHLGEGERRRHDAHDLEGAPVEEDCLPQDVRAAAHGTLPERPAQHYDAVTSLLVLLGSERPTQQGLAAQGSEQVGRYRAVDDPLRAIAAREIAGPGPVSGHVLERLRSGLPVDQIR